MTRRDHFVARPKEGMPDELDDFVRAVSKDDVFPVKAEFLGDGASQRPSAAVGIKVRALERFTHGCKGFRRRTQRIFVRGQLDDFRRLQTHLACQLLDRLAGFVGDKFQNMLVRGFPHRSLQFSVCQLLKENVAWGRSLEGGRTSLRYVTLH